MNNPIEEKDNAQITPDKKQEKIGVGSVIVGLIALAIIVPTFKSIFNEVANDSGPVTNKEAETKIEDYSNLDSAAYIVSKKYIESILKSPSTADFPFMDFTATHLGDAQYRVTSYVDSENSFGAMIRSDWTILMTYKGGSDTDLSSWELQEVVIDGEVMYP